MAIESLYSPVTHILVPLVSFIASIIISLSYTFMWNSGLGVSSWEFVAMVKCTYCLPSFAAFIWGEKCTEPTTEIILISSII